MFVSKSNSIAAFTRSVNFALLIILVLVAPASLRAATGGSISGAITDRSGAAIVGAAVNLVNAAQHTAYRSLSDKQGLYSFPNLLVGHYQLTITADGFSTQENLDLAVDSDSAIRVNASLEIATQSDTVTVSSGGTTQVDAVATHLGEVVSASQITALPLNGRSYTDLLAIQPGVAPMSTLLTSSVIMAGVTGSIDPSGDLNPGNLSINGHENPPMGS